MSASARVAGVRLAVAGFAVTGVAVATVFASGPWTGVRAVSACSPVGVDAFPLAADASDRARRPAEAPAGGPRAAFVGLAHVDLMDLHVARQPGGGLVDRELLPEADLADRFLRATGSGAGWNRWSLYWDMVERDAGGAFDWHVADAIVARDVSAGLRTLAILQGTPAHYATGGSSEVPVATLGGVRRADHGDAGLPREASLSASPPEALDEPAFVKVNGGTTDDPSHAARANPANPWAVFVGAAAARYKPGGALARERGWPSETGVQAWEIGNEPNLRQFWSGTPEQYARYLEVAYLVLRWSDPAAIVMHGGIADSSGAADWYDRFLADLQARGASSPLPTRYGYYFDKAAWHWYVYPNLLNTGPAMVRNLLAARGFPDKPVWVTEMGVPIWSEYPGPCWDPVSPWRATTDEAAAYVWQSLAEGIASGVEVMIFFQAYDDCGNGPDSYDAFGLVRNHRSNQCWVPPGHECWAPDEALYGVPRPAYGAAAWAVRELAQAELLWRPPEEAPRWQRVLFYRPPDTRVIVAWNWSRSSQVAEMQATGREAVVFRQDIDGQVVQQTVTPANGRYALVLPGATNRNNPGNGAAVMAGRPIMLVEKDVYAPFRALVEPLPETSPDSFDLGVAAADGGTGVAGVQVYVSEAPPGAGGTWRPLTAEIPWTELPRGGRMSVPFTGTPGRSYWFAAIARDRAGNVTAVPAQAQAWTRVLGAAASPTVEPTPGETWVPPPQASPTDTTAPTAQATASSAASPTPTRTPAGPPWTDSIALPIGFAAP